MTEEKTDTRQNQELKTAADSSYAVHRNGFSRLLERSLASLCVTALMLAFTSILAPLINNYETESILVNWFTYIVIAGSGPLFVLILQIFAQERIKVYLHVISVVFYITAVLVLCWIFGQENLPYVLIPVLTVQYILELVLNDMFVYHDIFLEECQGLSGRALETHLFHNNLGAIDFSHKARTAFGVLFVTPVLLLGEIFGVMFSGNKIGIFSLAFVLIFFLSASAVFFLIGLYKNDVFYGFLGFRDFIEDRRRLLRSALVILLISILPAILFSSSKALIKIQLLKEKNAPAQERPAEMKIPEPGDLYLDLDLDLDTPFGMLADGNSEPSIILELVYRLIRMLFIAGIAAGVLVFFLKPFLTSHWRDFWAEGKLAKIFRHIVEELVEFFKFTFSKKSEKEPYAAVQTRAFRSGIKDFLKKSSRSKKKAAELDRLTRHFMRLIEAGGQGGILYKDTMAPAEYTALLAELLASKRNGTQESPGPEAAERCGMLFEKALYDKEILSMEEEKEFIQCVELVLSGL